MGRTPEGGTEGRIEFLRAKTTRNGVGVGGQCVVCSCAASGVVCSVWCVCVYV